MDHITHHHHHQRLTTNPNWSSHNPYTSSIPSMEDNHHPAIPPFDHHHYWPHLPSQFLEPVPVDAAAAEDVVVDGEDEEEEEEEEEEELGAMKEMMFKIAAMQPVDIDPATIRKPRRRNVRISDDPQSVAARHRRERISERIRILQRLVPGGTKMDTASMLDEAIRYVKFLKRQIRLLQGGAAGHNQTPCIQDWGLFVPGNNSNPNNNSNTAATVGAATAAAAGAGAGVETTFNVSNLRSYELL